MNPSTRVKLTPQENYVANRDEVREGRSYDKDQQSQTRQERHRPVECAED